MDKELQEFSLNNLLEILKISGSLKQLSYGGACIYDPKQKQLICCASDRRKFNMFPSNILQLWLSTNSPSFYEENMK